VKPEKGEASAIKFKSRDSYGAFYYFLPGHLREMMKDGRSCRFKDG